MTDPHLDDDALSAALDAPDADPHAATCVACGRRLAALAAARDAVAAATVAPLAPGVVDSWVTAALAAAVTAEKEPAATAPAPPVAPIGQARSTWRARPPAGWLVAAAAGIAALAGVAGLVRAGTSTEGSASLTSGAGVAADKSLPGAAVESESFGGDESAVAGATGAPIDLGDVDSPETLIAALGATTAQAAPPGAAAPQGEITPTAGSARTTSGGTVTTTAPAGTADAAVGTAGAAAPPGSCLGEAERIGAGRFAGLAATATVRWKGQPAEVYVFRLTTPEGGLSRQALVLARPGCGLLADPRL